MPHEHFVIGREGTDVAAFSRIWLFIINDEIIPETHRLGLNEIATFSLLGGFALMMYLDATLG